MCSSRAWWPLAPNFCLRATRKSQIFHTNHMLGTLDFTVSEHPSIFLRAQPCFYCNVHSLRKQAFCDATTGFPSKWCRRNDCRNSFLMMHHYPDLDSASDWFEANLPCGMTKQKHYPALGSDMSWVWNFCAHSSDIISQGNQWWCHAMLAVFSSYDLPYRKVAFVTLGDETWQRWWLHVTH